MADPRDEEIAELRRQLAERDAIIADLRADLAELKEKLGKSSKNSSKPPSSDRPGAKARPKKRSSGRKPGGQPGHKRHHRELVLVEEVDTVVACIPKKCEDCAGVLRGQDPEPHRHQVFDLPPVRPVVTEYQQHALDCGQCGHRTVGGLPAGVPSRTFGPTVDATIAILMGVYRLTKRQVPDLMRDFFGLRMSVGAVIGCQQAASAAIAEPVAEARAHVKVQAVKHADETGWREGIRRSKAWLWAVVTQHVVIFMIHAQRNAQAAKELLGDWHGVLVSDRYSGYHWWPDCRRQFCWAHLKRDIQAITERGADSARLGKAMLEEVARMFSWWHRVRDGTLARSTFRVYMRTVQQRFETLLADGTTVSHSKTSATCAQLLKHRHALWTFVYIEGVEPTNNDAEQVVRHGVIMRKISYGTHSAAGSRFIERMLTVHGTLRRQQRSVLDFMRTACNAALAHHPAPSLLPIEAQEDDLRRAA
ncbi:IS66 family transposase [Mycobacterium sp.]|uniref:IS66 family transposase n=1 Tax=Mycobacterium sp. TaxID=1785 RepID=UPI003BAE2C05